MTSYIYDMVDTWNAGATTFTAVKMNVTDTASAAGSLLMDLQVGGSSRFKVGKDGSVTIPGSANTGYLAGSNAFLSDVALTLGSSALVRWTNGTYGGTVDTILSRRGTANLRLGAADAAAPVAQTLSVQSVVAGTSNTAGTNLTITGSQGTGTGAGGSIVFQVAPAGSSGTAQNALVTFLEATSTRAFNLYNTTDVTTNYERGKIAWSSNVLQIGTEKAGTGTARALEFQTDGVTRLSIATNGQAIFSGNVFAGASSLLAWTSRSRMSSSATGLILFTNANADDFDRLQFGGTTSSFPALKRSSTTLQARLADDSAFASVQGKLTTDTAYTAGDPTTTGYLVVYDSTGTAYRVPAVLN